MLLRPFLKWPGGKHRALEQLLPHLPSGQRLVEPFTGSGAVFLNTAYPRYLLGDRNQDLMMVYRHLKQEGEEFIQYCASFFKSEHNQAGYFYARREEFNRTLDTRRKAALFVFLNRHGYNGLCRYNQQGLYNVPFGRYKRPYFPHDEMRHAHQKLRRAVLKCVDFARIERWIRPGDVIYCDPPYVPLSATAHFTQYSPFLFDQQAQLTLVDFAKKMVEQGHPVLISNHDTPFVRQAYQGARLHRIQVRRSISCHGQKRAHAAEVLAVWLP